MVVREVEGEEAVFHLNEWRTDSSDDGEEEEGTAASRLVEHGMGEWGLGECTPENWD